jgi:hypothetical protein
MAAAGVEQGIWRFNPRLSAAQGLSLYVQPFAAAQLAGNLRVLAMAEYNRLLTVQRAINPQSGFRAVARANGPVISVGKDLVTGKVSRVYSNNLQGRRPTDLSAKLLRNLRRMPDDVAAFKRTHGPGSHAEIYVIDELLKLRPDASLSEIAVFTMEIENPNFLFQFKPACSQCAWILEDVLYVR